MLSVSRRRVYSEELAEVLRLKNLDVKIYKVNRLFKTVISPSQWLVIEEFTKVDYDFARFAGGLTDNKIPFVCIMNSEGSFFLDLGREYNSANLRSIDIFDTYEKVNLGSSLLIYNYNAFADYDNGLRTWIVDSADGIREVSEVLGLNYIIRVKRLDVLPRNISVEFSIVPKYLSLKGLHLSYQVYDEWDELTLKFLNTLLKVLEKFQDVMEYYVSVYTSDGFKTKRKLLNEVEKEIMLVLRHYGIPYKVSSHEDNVEKRIKNLESTIKKVKLEARK